MELFNQDVRNAERVVNRATSRSVFIKILTLGFLNGHERVLQAEEALRTAEQQLHYYNDLTGKADQLDDELNQIEVIEGVRVSKNTFSDLPAFGHDDYPPNWEELRKQVLIRDIHSCQEFDGTCDGPLQIHHKQELSKGGSNAIENLITLCQYHHCKKHPHMMTRYYGNFRS